MARETNTQIKELLQKSKKILITTAKEATGDGLASSLALFLFLKKINKNCEIIIDDFTLPKEYAFLPQAEEVKKEAARLKKFVISLNTAQTGIEELSYDLDGQNLKIYVSPKQGVFTPEDLKFATSEFTYDLIIVLNTSDLESLGKLYDHHRDLFYQLPVINIDHQPTNEQYGHLNLTDMTAASTSEIVFALINDWPEKMLDEKIATCLLTGLISATRGFRTTNVTPRTLAAAGELIKLGANRQNIINQLYQTKTIDTLKLWGRLLARLQYDPQTKLVSSKLNPFDFTESNTTAKDLNGVVDELIAHNPLAELIIIFYQIEAGQSQVLAKSLSSANLLNLLRPFAPQGSAQQASFALNKNLEETEKEVINLIAQQLKPII